MSEQPATPADEVEAHLRSTAAPVSDSHWTTGEDVDAHLTSRFARGTSSQAPADGRTYPTDGDDDVEGHFRFA